MYRWINAGLLGVAIATVCSGCASYSSEPPIGKPGEPADREHVASFTYEVNSPWKNSRFESDAYAATLKIIPEAQAIGSNRATLPLPTLAINITQASSGGACGQDYLTGLSLGLIPTWCTRSGLYTFNFALSNAHGVCRQRTYSLSSTSYSHLTLIPFALFAANDQPLVLYQAALKSFLQNGQCSP
ncbi:hypothetical protein [Pseudomonas sp.]|uniref:hypothetical protein n=1 Tax=Pseudomonas sp. TaxID=306 RepID=UPI0028AC6845|nr:hypothetical protein [Pseudomonas sp.]